MKVSKYLIIGILGLSTLSAYSHDEVNSNKSAKADSEPTVQMNNFARKSVGYNSVINSESKAAFTENRIGDIGIVNKSWMKRKGSVGYNSIFTPFPKQDLVSGYNSCVSMDGKLVKLTELSDRKVITNQWSKRKGSIGYHSIISNTEELTACD